MAPRMVGGRATPRDLVLAGTPEFVSDAALLSVILREDDVALGARLARAHPIPTGLWSLRAEDLTVHEGIGPAKAAALLASVELARRASLNQVVDRPAISTPEDVVSLCEPQLRGCDREHFWALALNTKNRLIKIIEVSIGSLSASIVHPRELFKEAVRSSAASVVVVHNHPSGDPTPSSADIHLTQRLVRAGDVLGIEVLDHVVIGEGGRHASLREMGLM
ncbi:DNA repair protein RadC [Coriobacteriia bacterium Es71-Z0120]|uniref:RadC family protein n=1 Tax=Parvivirga hydrogeniphila TaxID=2939460 RepID=UPI002260CB30|nr:DNA repair protein RadC [Parvivirga hydrogeniphila]MCL4078960.1 DNA repair protein RadC [Parvivirga hydrogeniphila]